ncbi:cold shock domain-containing protein [Rhodoferax sp. PAMC 29310]|uniref:cold shock domain-containing protein n=1 Tax=Rhodoferax sp. PAMC 29310 TaxID=2822760 RepID=UPI001B33C6B6|nr:cold shock domain-containing protein [Rhodoferax sp. PAMC 29310]
MEAKRYAGKLSKWNSERGFGFILSDDSGQDLFVHISAFPRDSNIPVDGESLTFEVEADGANKKRAVRVQRGGLGQRSRPRGYQPMPAHLSRSPARQGFGSRVIVILLLAGLGMYGYKHYEARASQLRAASMQSVNEESPAAIGVTNPVAPPPTPARPLISATPQASAGFRCDGRNMCSQMNSCQEATLFLKNCPSMKMDGNNDGVPCEKQWCN